jgi:hypothetical protein
MAVYTGSRSITESLILVLDPDDTRLSFLGEPTTNVLNNTNLDLGWEKGYHYDVIIGDSYPKPPGITSQSVSFRTANTYGYWYSYGDYAPQADNTTYSISVWGRTVGENFAIQPYTADNNESHRFWMGAQTITGNGEWQRLTWPNAYTTPANNDSDSLSFHFPGIPIGQRCWLLAPQLEPLPYCTPFVVGSREATIYDVSSQANNFTINGQVRVVDGSFTNFSSSNRIIRSGFPTNLKASQFGSGYTVLVWANSSAGSAGGWRKLIGNADGDNYIDLYQNPSGYWAQECGSTLFVDGVQVSNGSYYMPGTGWHMYGATNFNAGTTSNPSQGLSIGLEPANTSYVWSGSIGKIMIFNRILGSDEMMKVFHATRGRYNL